MKITVITPSFNQGQFLEESILSVLNQNYNDLEYIIIDGGSTDNSVDIIKKYQHRLTYWVSEKDSGQSEAINKGFIKASGDIVTWLCSDDTFMPDTLHEIRNEFDNSLNSNLGLIYGGTRLFNSNNFERKDYGYKNASIERYISGMAFPQPSSFFKLKYLKQVGFLDESLHFGMDYDLFMRLALVCDFKFVDSIFSNYRLQKDSKSELNQNRFIEDWIKSYRSLLKYYKKVNLLKILNGLDIYDDKHETIKDIPKSNFKINWNLSFYYFLTYVLKSDYISCNLARARAIGLYLIKYHLTNLIKDKVVFKILIRLILLPNNSIIKMRLLKEKICV